jgi:hypothetical protein
VKINKVKLLLIILLISSGYANVASPEKVDDNFLYGGEFFEKYREIQYWANISISVKDYNYGSGDAEFLKLSQRNPN